MRALAARAAVRTAEAASPVATTQLSPSAGSNGSPGSAGPGQGTSCCGSSSGGVYGVTSAASVVNS